MGEWRTPVKAKYIGGDLHEKIKNVFLVLVVLLSLFIWWPNRAAANGVNYGDVNNDGSINVNDVILVLQDVVQ